MSTVIPLITRLSTRVVRVLGCNPGPMTLQGTNTYIIGTGERRILLDTGDEKKADYITALEGVLKEQGAVIERVLLTHWHHDHVGGAAAITKSRTLSTQDCTFHKIPRTDVSHEDSYGISCLKLHDGEKISTEGATIKVIQTPGHTADHAAFWLEEEQALFTGDCVLGEGTTVLEKLSDYMKSLSTLLSLNAKVLYPGHGPHVLDAQQHISAYITHREKRERQILDCLTNLKSNTFVSEHYIVQSVYQGLPENLIPAATINVNQHLIKLLEENLAMQNSMGEWALNIKGSGKL